MERDNLTYDDAKGAFDEAYDEAQGYLEDGNLASIEQILSDEFGLEPDYLFDLIELEY